MRALLFAAFLLAAPASAQYGSNPGWLSSPITAPADPGLLARAYGGVALPSAESGGFLLNPARVSLSDPGVSLSGPLARPDYFSYPDDDAGTISSASARAVFGHASWRFGAAVGGTSQHFGRSEEQLDSDGQVVQPGGASANRSFVLAGSIGYVGRVSASVGLAARRTAQIDPVFSQNPTAWGADLGALVSADVVEPNPGGGFSLLLGLGYAAQNLASDMQGEIIGGNVNPDGMPIAPSTIEVRYPSDRYARLGWSATLGYDGRFRNHTVRLVEAAFTFDASHSVLRSDPDIGEDANLEARGGMPVLLGRIRPLDALLGRGRSPAGEPFCSYDDEECGEVAYRPAVTGHRSLSIGLLETLDLSLGTHSDPAQGPDGHTAVAFGAGLSVAGLLRSRLLGEPSGALARLADLGDLHLQFARYAIYGENDNYANDGDVDQPWTLGATLSVAWP